tara:strand:+ start:898 stop:1023 length:126 start_codon:yes stop_codon:yes gene_type:complete
MGRIGDSDFLLMAGGQYGPHERFYGLFATGALLHPDEHLPK